MNIYFDKDNCNGLIFETDKKHYLAIPPSKNCIDILNFDGINSFKFIKNETYYLFDTDAYIIITNDTDRTVYHKGKIACQTKLTY